MRRQSTNKEGGIRIPPQTLKKKIYLDLAIVLSQQFVLLEYRPVLIAECLRMSEHISVCGLKLLQHEALSY